MKTKMLVIGLLLKILLTHHLLAQSITLTNDGISEITRFLSDAVELGTVPTIEAIVVNKDGVLYHEVFGKRDLNRNKDLAKGNLFDIASMTKQVTAAGVMILFDEGKLNLDDPASRYLPALANLEVLASFDENDTTYTTVPVERPITIRNLLNHTSGMAYPWWDRRLRMIVEQSDEPGFYHYDYLQLPLLFQPGDGWSYGISSRVLGDIIEAVTGQRLNDFLMGRIFQPLSMHNTMFTIPVQLEYRRVKVYRRGDNGWVENAPENSHQPYVLGDATLISTGEDFGRFLQMLLNTGELEGVRILSEQSVKMMNVNQIGDLFIRELFNGFPIGAGIDKFGLGFQLRTDTLHEQLTRSPGSYSWGGSFNTFFWGDPAHEIAAVLLMHYLPFFDDTAQDLLDGFEKRIYRYLH